MNKVWLFLVAIWKIIVWFNNRNVAIQKKRTELKKEVRNAIKTGNTRALHRAMSNL